MAEELQLSLLGDVVVRRDGVPVTDVGSSKALALLCFLALTGRPHLRSTLAGLLWGDRSETRARSNLSKALTHLRRVVGPFLSITRQAVAFNRERSYWLDVERFEALAGRATLEAMSASAAPLQADIERLEQAVELYRGDLLEGFYVRQAPAFEDWVLAQRARLRELALQALHRLLVHHVRRGAAGLAAGIEVATRLLALEPWREDAHRQLMTLLAQSGQRGAALAQYKTCRQVLAKELGVEPGVETTALYEQIRDGEVASQRQKETILQAPAIVTQPPAVLDSTLAALGGERRPVTVLQAKVGEAAALLDEIGHERWTATLNDVLQIASSTIERYGGEVHERHGDGLIALFGVPSAHEDDAERAILAALAMQDQIASYIAERRTRHAALRLGMDSGEVLITVANDRQQAIGRALTLAGQAEANAEPGTVLVSEHTYRLATPLFEWQALGEIAAQGVRQPLAVYRPLARKVILGKGRGVAGLQSPLVGRDAELGVLGEALERLRAGVGGIVTIVGEAGIGKSRLVAELRKDPVAAPVRWVEGRCLSYGSSISYLLWLDMLRSIVGMSIEDSPLAIRDELRRLVLALCQDQADDVYPYLGQLLSLPLEVEAEARISGVGGES